MTKKKTGAIDKTYSKKSKNFKIQFEHHGEGFDGEYRMDDPEDKPLLRCDVIYNKEPNEPIHNGSFCTNISINVNESEMEKLLNRMIDEAEELFNEYGKDNLGTLSRRLAKYSYCSDNELGIIHYEK